MFSKLFRKQTKPDRVAVDTKLKQPDRMAADILQVLDESIRKLHPDRFGPTNATTFVNGPRMIANTFLGRPQTERPYPLDYELLVARIGDYARSSLLADTFAVAQNEPAFHAFLLGVAHELKLRAIREPHDATNLGKEVRTQHSCSPSASTMAPLPNQNHCAARLGTSRALQKFVIRPASNPRALFIQNP